MTQHGPRPVVPRPSQCEPDTCAPLAGFEATLNGVRETVLRVESKLDSMGATASALALQVAVHTQQIMSLEARAKINEDSGRHWSRYAIVLLLGIVLTVAGFVALQAMKVIS